MFRSEINCGNNLFSMGMGGYLLPGGAGSVLYGIS